MQHQVIDIQAFSAVADAPLDLAVVIPTFNEAANVERLLARLAVVLAGISWEAVFVDDNSPDGTAELVRSIARTNRQVRIVHRMGRRGLTSAVIEGALATAAPVIAVIDGDMQHDETVLPRLFDMVISGQADVAIGSRYADGGGTGDWNANRLKLSQWATSFGQWALKVDVSDPMSGFFAISRAALMGAVPRLSDMGFKVLVDILASSPTPLKTSEVPYIFRSRDAGESKAGALIAAQYLGLIADKLVGRYIPVRLLSFVAVGSFGVVIHLSLLWLLLGLSVSFATASICAVSGAMTANFLLNNIFTYQDRRLRGWGVMRGLVSYCAVCSLGAVANIGIGTWLNGQHQQWWLAGLAGIIVGTMWNFTATAMVTWRKV